MIIFFDSSFDKKRSPSQRNSALIFKAGESLPSFRDGIGRKVLVRRLFFICCRLSGVRNSRDGKATDTQVAEPVQSLISGAVGIGAYKPIECRVGSIGCTASRLPQMVLLWLRSLWAYCALPKWLFLCVGLITMDTRIIKCSDTGETVCGYENYMITRHWINRRKIFISKIKSCELCGSKIRLQVHHKHYKNIGNENDSDICVLCRKCHLLVHRIHSKNKNVSLSEVTISVINNTPIKAKKKIVKPKSKKQKKKRYEKPLWSYNPIPKYHKMKKCL
jgi:hypothetical protein